MNPPGYMSPSSLRGVLMAGMKPFPQLSYEELQSEGYVVVGSPEKVTARLRELHDELGFGQLIGLFVLGGMTHEQAIHSMELFSTKVMSALRPLGVAKTTALPPEKPLTGTGASQQSPSAVRRRPLLAYVVLPSGLPVVSPGESGDPVRSSNASWERVQPGDADEPIESLAISDLLRTRRVGQFCPSASRSACASLITSTNAAGSTPAAIAA
ncbi:hypothetical protein [Kibdelosporangium aridum]|uniref:hypothetical protein n=1 Tax=Kibdelosporangium aridum TaxID=2030 RepID=UPI0035EE987D